MSHEFIGFVAVLAWLIINLKYTGVTFDDVQDYLYNKGLDLKRRKIIRWRK